MRRFLLSFVVGLVITLPMVVSGGRASAAINYCIGDYVVPGGVSSVAGVKSAYSHPRVAHVYKYFGISRQDINGMAGHSVSGAVTKSGNVIVGGKVVATHAISAGCGFIAGSTKVNDGYMTFYTRPTSVSFAKSSLPAMVVMKDHKFSYAILKSCGNPVKATPVKPRSVITKTVTQTQVQTQTIVVNNSPPQVKAAQTTTPPATSLPNTGAGDVLGIFTGVSSAGAAGHYLFSRRRQR